ncbi:MAG: hypothetical protein E7462_04435 [Ruminococcaceae bacterium]|nr:hypothetical protein [Oscillospiraceae bacterium]
MKKKQKRFADDGWVIWVDGDDTSTVYINDWINPKGKSYEASIYDIPSYCMYTTTEGYYIIGVLPVEEALFSRTVSMYIFAFLEIIVFGIFFLLVYFLVKRVVVDNIYKVNDSLAQITGGNLDVTVDVRSNEEFVSLSNDINSTMETLKRYIAEAAARIDKELEYAKTIQLSALPSKFPPFPEQTDFDIYAQMIAAKEVGGDFYDFICWMIIR